VILYALELSLKADLENLENGRRVVVASNSSTKIDDLFTIGAHVSSMVHV
jgi:hypothetical protein